jgi:transposase
MEVETIGLDIAKSVFQLHAVDANGNLIVPRQIKRRAVLAFFQKLAPRGRHRSLRLVALLLARAQGARP